MQDSNVPWRFNAARAALLAAMVYFAAPAGVNAGPEMAAEELALQPPLVLATVPRQVLMKKAARLFSTGRAAKARALYEYLAAQGDPEAARGVASTYDSLLLGTAQTEETYGDPDQARWWYQRARELEGQRAAAAEEVPEVPKPAPARPMVSKGPQTAAAAR